MMTWLLWRALQNPYSEHALFRHLILRQRRKQSLRWRDIIPLPNFVLQNNIWGALWGMALVLLLCSGGWLLILPVIALTPVALIAAGTFQGAYIAVRVGTALAREREQGRITLNSVTPGGMAGAAWAICSFVYHTNRTVTQIRDTVRGVHLVLFIGIAVIGFVAVLNWLFTRDVTYSAQNPDLSSEMLLQVLRLMALLTALYVDFVQSTVLGMLAGILTSTVTRSRLDAGGLGFGAFMAVQLLFYVGVFIVDFIILPLLFSNDLHPGLMLAQFAVFYLSREAMLLFGWRIMAYRLQSDPDEMYNTLGLRLAWR